MGTRIKSVSVELNLCTHLVGTCVEQSFTHAMLNPHGGTPYSPLIVALNVALQHIKVGQFTNSHFRKNFLSMENFFSPGKILICQTFIK